MAKAVNSKLEADANYEPTEEEMAMLGPEFIEKLKMRVKGLLRRGRPVAASKAKDGMIAAMKNVGDEDTDMDGDVDDEDLDIEDINEIKKQPMKKQKIKKFINEEFIRMQKLAGLNEDDGNESTGETINITFTSEPLTVTFYEDDFDNKKEFIDFKRKLSKNERFAYDTFFDNIDYDFAYSKQNQDNWKIEIK